MFIKGIDLGLLDKPSDLSKFNILLQPPNPTSVDNIEKILESLTSGSSAMLS